ncbi:MAG: hypothetical protein ACI4SG_04495 [Oligosphaeraceae bacterium]
MLLELGTERILPDVVDEPLKSVFAVNEKTPANIAQVRMIVSAVENVRNAGFPGNTAEKTTHGGRDSAKAKGQGKTGKDTA